MLLSDVYLAVLWTCSFNYCFQLTWVKSIKMGFTQYKMKTEKHFVLNASLEFFSLYVGLY